jgi:DNA-binding response OmpR family regulator
VRVLIVDDEPIVRRLHEASLTGWGYQVTSASSGEQAWELFQNADPPALAILDWTMPGMDGLELCTRIRALGREPKPYLIFVTAKARTQDIVTGLGAGADDYIVKPFAMQEVVARLQALLRRQPAPGGKALEVGDLRLDPRARTAYRGERVLDLTRREFELLEFLMHHPGEVVERRRLHEEVWGYTFDPGTNVADVFVGYVRRKLEAGGEPRVLHTVRGVGFVLRS